jgi:hypothetical protein
LPILTVRNSVVGVGFVRAAAVTLVVAGVLSVALAAKAIRLGSKFPLICPSWASWFHRSNGSIFSSVGVGIAFRVGGANGLDRGTGGGAGVLEGILSAVLEGTAAGTVTVRTTVLGSLRGSLRGIGGGVAGRVATGRGVRAFRGDDLSDGSTLGLAVFCGFSVSSFCWSW